MSGSILIVDDEINILKSLKRLLFETNYSVFTAENGIEALEILEKKQIDLIISDIKMPAMDGYQLLKRVKEKHPDTITLILSGYVEKELIFKLIQENLSNLCVIKPWDNTHLLAIVNRLFYIRNKFAAINLSKILTCSREINNLEEPFYFELVDNLEKGSNIDLIINTIEKDPVLTVRILSFVNNIYKLNTASLKKALDYLSMDELKNIIIHAVLSNINKLGKSRYKEHLTLSHVTSELVYHIYNGFLHKKIPENFKNIGALAYIGEIFTECQYKQEFNKIIHISKKENNPLNNASKTILMISFQQITVYLLKWWNIPDYISEIIFSLDDPLNNKVKNKELASVLHIAVYHSYELFGIIPYRLKKETYNFLNLDEEKIYNYNFLIQAGDHK